MTTMTKPAEGEQRQQPSEAQSASDRASRLRKESADAATAHAAAMDKVAKAAGQLSDALEVVQAQGKILSALHQSLASFDPNRAGEVDQDYRDAQALLGTIYTQKRSDLRAAAASAQYRLQRPADGTDPAVEQNIPLLDDAEVLVGTKYSAGRTSVLDWETSALQALDAEQHEEQAEAWADHVARVEVAGLGILPSSLSEVREAAHLDAATIAMVIPDALARSLSGLTTFLPASASEGISVRSVPRSALEARQGEARLQEGVQAIRALVTPI